MLDSSASGLLTAHQNKSQVVKPTFTVTKGRRGTLSNTTQDHSENVMFILYSSFQGTGHKVLNK